MSSAKDPEMKTSTIQKTQNKKIPIRTCVGCGTERPKAELIRIIRTPDGRIDIDPTLKKNGRGAYLCPDPDCLEKAIRRKGLQRALETGVSPEVYEALKQVLTAENVPAAAESRGLHG